MPDCMFPYKHYDAGLIEDADEAARREAGGIFQAVLQAAPDRAGPADNRRGINKNAFVIID